jgi:hypothetical protein
MDVMFMDQQLSMEQDFITIHGTTVIIIIIIILMVFLCDIIHIMAGVLDLFMALLTIGTVIPIGVEVTITGVLRITDHPIMAGIIDLNLPIRFIREEVE